MTERDLSTALLTDKFHLALPACATFRITSSTYFRTVLAGGAKGGVWVGVLTVAGVSVIGMLVLACLRSDLRFALVAMMIMFMAVPMLMAGVYFNITLSPEATKSTLPQTVRIDEDMSVRIEYTVDDEDAEFPRPVPKPEVISLREIIDIRRNDKYLVLRLDSGRLLVIPHEAFRAVYD